MRPKPFTAILFLFVLSLLLTTPAYAQWSRIGSGDAGNPASLVLRGGFTGRIWSPKGFEPYTLDGYSRSAVFGALEWRHPLQPFGDNWDVIDIPYIEYNNNFAEANFQPESGVLPQESGDYNNYRYAIWGIFLDFLSIRYEVDAYQSKFIDERAAFEDLLSDPGRYIRVWETWTRQFEVGIIGSPSDEVENTELEIGYYRARLQWPLIDWDREDRYADSGGLFLIQDELMNEGFYAALHSEPIENIWPLQSRLRVQVGGIFGISAWFRLEQKIWKQVRGGVDFEAEWRTLNNARDKYDVSVDLRSRSPRETRFRVRAFIAMQVY